METDTENMTNSSVLMSQDYKWIHRTISGLAGHFSRNQQHAGIMLSKKKARFKQKQAGRPKTKGFWAGLRCANGVDGLLPPRNRSSMSRIRSTHPRCRTASAVCASKRDLPE